jgi:hypothetical protein
MLISIATTPLMSALFASDPSTPSNALSRWILPNALVSGAVLGLIQWLLLRQPLRIGVLWIACTALGMAVAAWATRPLQTQVVAQALVGGAILGAARWPLLQARLPNAWLWVLASAVAGLVQWPLALLIGQTMSVGLALAPVFGAVNALVTGLALVQLVRRAATEPLGAQQHAPDHAQREQQQHR